MTVELENDGLPPAQCRLRIYHGPVNIAGIGRYLADWQRNKCVVSDFIVFNENPITSNSHLSLRTSEHRGLAREIIRLKFFLQCLFKYDLFHFYFAKSLLPLNLDLPVLRLFRKKIIMTYCGSDIRLLEVERKRNDYWQLIDSAQDGLKFDLGKKRLMRWQKLWVHRVFAPRNLYESVRQVFPEKMVVKDLWIHNLMDLNSYKPESFETKTPPVIVHAPSHKGLKGTDFVERVLQELKQNGYEFEYRRIEGIENIEAQRIYREEADIILDQFVLGGFGTLAVEAMFYGKPVLCYLIDEVKQQHFPDVPIVNTTIDSLHENLIWLIENPEERIRLGKAGRTFVETYFDNEKVNTKLWDLYQSLY